VSIKQKRCILKWSAHSARYPQQFAGVTIVTILQNLNIAKEPRMPTVSVKLAEETKRRLDNLAASQGIKPHALMVRAIESTLSNAEQQQSFVAAALRSRQNTIQTGLVIDGPLFGDYLKARVRGDQAKRPSPQRIDALVIKAA